MSDTLDLPLEELDAERDMLGQILTFCAFIGGISLAGLIQLLVDGEQFINDASFVLANLHGAGPQTRWVLMSVMVWLLTATATTSLLGAFCAVLGFTSFGKLRGVIDRLRTHGDTEPWRARTLLGRYGTFHVFHLACRGFAVCSMALSLLLVFFLFAIVLPQMWLVWVVVVPLLLLPLFGNTLFRKYLFRRYRGVSVGGGTWSWASGETRQITAPDPLHGSSAPVNNESTTNNSAGDLDRNSAAAQTKRISNRLRSFSTPAAPPASSSPAYEAAKSKAPTEPLEDDGTKVS